MKTYDTKLIKKEVTVLKEYKCDKCGKNLIKAEDDLTDEAYSFDFYGGYASKFGDMNHIECDLCHTCLYELIDKYCRFNGVKG